MPQIVILKLTKLFKNVNFMKTQIFYEIKFDLKGHPRSYKTTFMPKPFKHIRLLTDLMICMNANIMKIQLNYDLNTTFTYVLMNNVCPCLIYVELGYLT